MTPWTQGTGQATQIKMSLVAAWCSDALMAKGCGSDPRHLRGLWWQHGLWIPIQTLAVVELRTQTWSRMAAQVQVAAQVNQTGISICIFVPAFFSEKDFYIPKETTEHRYSLQNNLPDILDRGLILRLYREFKKKH